MQANTSAHEHAHVRARTHADMRAHACAHAQTHERVRAHPPASRALRTDTHDDPTNKRASE
eukprot:3519119-Alexandrium_andersonii.AAC.1